MHGCPKLGKRAPGVENWGRVMYKKDGILKLR